MYSNLGSNKKRFSAKMIALLICVTLIVQTFWTGGVAFGASPYYFRGYDVENITGSTFTTSGATVNSTGSLVTMTDVVEGEAIGFVAFDELDHDISTSIDLGSLEIDFSTTTTVTEEGLNGEENDVPTVHIDFCRSNYSTVISSVELSKPDNTVSGSVSLTSGVSIPVGTRSVIIYLRGANTSGENTVLFENTSFIIHDAAAPTCSVDYNSDWTNQPVTVTISASDSDSGLEGVYKNGVKMTAPYTFTVDTNTSFSVYSKDYAGKTSPTQNISITNIDTTAPAAPASLTLSHTDWTNTDVSVTVPALGATSGAPERYVYRLNGGVWADMPANFAVTESGQHTIDVAVADAAGNMSSAVSGTIKIDKLAPSIDHVGTEVSSGSVNVTVEASDTGLSGLAELRYAEGSHDAEYFRSGGGTEILGGTFTVAAGGVFTIWAVDNAGNDDFGEYTLNTAPTIAHTNDFEMDEDDPQTVILDIADAETALSALVVTAQSSNTDIISEVQVNREGEQVSINVIPETNVSGGPVTITITVRDEQGETVTDSFAVTVRPVNDDPIAVDDEGIVTTEDTSIRIDVLANDYDTADGDTLTITDAGTPQHGTTAIASGQIRYTPAADYNGTDQFTYTISDGNGGTASATVFISATAENDAPVAVADTAKVDEDGSVLIDVVANDTDIDMTSTDTEVLSLYSVTNGAHGTAVMEDGMVRYTPEADFFGKDTFSYVVTDTGGLTSIGTVAVTVKGVEDAPIFVDLNAEYTISEDSVGAEITFSIHDAETEAASLMLQAVSLDDTQNLLKTSGITISGLGDDNDEVTLHITPVANAFGDVTVSLTLGDGFTTVTRTFILHISNVNDAPTAKNDTVTFDEGSDTVLIETASLIANDTDIDGDTLSFAGIESTTSEGTLEQVDADTLRYTPPADFDGEASFTYTVSDGNGGTAVGTCTLTIMETNDAPVITFPGDPFTTDEDTAGAYTFTISDEETDAADLIVRAFSGNTEKVDSTGIAVVNNGDGTCTLTITPMADAFGAVTLSITVSDGSTTTSKPLTLTINPTPDAPVAVNDNIYVSISGRRTFAVLSNDHDADGDALTVVPDSWELNSLSGQLTFNEATQTFTYRAANAEVGVGTFTYQVTDGEYISGSATVTLSVNTTTHAPEISMIANQRIVEDTSTGLISITVTDEDLGDTATLSVMSTNTTLLPVDYENNVLITDLGGGSFTLQLRPAADESGTSYITVTATDSEGKTDSTGFLLTVYPTNDAPVAVDDSFTTAEDTSVTLTPLANDTDPEGDTIWLNGVSWPSHGYLYRTGSNYVYVPYANWNGTETLTYTVTDGQSSDTGTVTITVTPVNDAPVNYSNWVELPNSAGQGATVDVLSGDYDPDGDTVRLYQIVSEPAYGTAVMDTETGQITYTRTSVSPNANGADQLTYRIIDRDTATGDYSYDDAVLYIGIEFNSSLHTYSDYVYCFEDDPAFTFDLSIYNPNSVDYTLTIDDTTSLGTLEVVDHNTVRFTPAANQNGGAWIGYTVTSGSESTTGSFYIRVYPVNDAPVIDSAPASVTCVEDSDGATFTVTFQDDDCADSDLQFYAYARNANTAAPVVLTVDIVIDRQTGQAVVTAKPVANANGEVDIVVGVSDGLACAEQTVHMTVTPEDDAPVPTAVSRTLYEDMDVTFSVLTPNSEVDGDALIVSIEDGDGPSHGTAVLNADGTITYTPDADYYGNDSLVFTVTDDTVAGLSATRTASFTILPVNDQPEITNLNYYQTTREDTPVDVTLTVSDVDNILTDASCYTLTSNNQTLVPDGNISISHVSGMAMKISVTPALNAYGTAIITVVASDGELTAEGQFKLTVQSVNDVPVAVNDTASVDETVGYPAGTTSVTVNLTDNDTDVEPGVLRVVRIENVSVGEVVNNGDGTATLTVDGDFNGIATFDYTVMDVDGATATATATVTVVAQNDPPHAANDTAEATEDTDVTISVLDNDTDADGDTLSIASVTNPAHGIATISGTDIVYSPNDDYNGTDSFSYTVSDGHSGTATAQVTVAVSAVNDAPEIAKYPAEAGEWTMSEDTTAEFTFVVSDAETASESLIITINSLDTDVIANPGIVLSTNAEGQKVIKVTPQENQSGVVPVEFRVSDGVLTTMVTWNITITAVNDAPEIITSDISMPEDSSYTGKVTATDVENDALTFSPGLAPAHGSVTINADGSFTYTPAANYVGEDVFGVYVSDGQAENNLDYGLVHVTVTPVNDKPDAVNDTPSTPEDTAVVINVIANDTDVDLPDDTLTIVSVGTPSHGTAEIVEGGIRYTPAANWSGTDTFTYTIKDNEGERDTATVTVTVSPVNDAPAAANDTAETNEDTAVTVDVTANDTDVDTAYGDEISVSSVGTAGHGTVAIVEGGIRYTPAADWNGEDSFDYTITDGDVESTATVTVTVHPVNDLPYFVTNPAAMSLTEDEADGSSTFTVGDIETPAANLTVTFISSSNTTLVDSGDVTISSGTDGERTVVVNPNDNRNGTANIKLRITDADGGYAEYTFTVTVGAVNDVPSAQNDSATTNENTAVTINVLANDDVDTATGNEGDTLTLLTVTNGTYGTVEIVSNQAVYTPDANRTVTTSYTDTFTYTMKDASGAESGATVTVTVTPVNDAPIITDPIMNVSFDEDTAGGTGPIAFTVTDEEDIDDTLVVTATSSNTALIPVANITITNPEGGDGSERTVQAVAVTDGYGSADITLTVTDSGGRTDTVTFTVTVDPVDDPLGTGTKDYTVVEDVQKQLMVLADADVDDPSYLTVTQIVTPASHGTVSIAGDGKSLYYITDLNSNEADTFVYRVHDAFSNVDYDITANITVTPVNDAPVVTLSETSYTTFEGIAVNDIPFTVTDVDNDIDTEVTLSASSSNPILVLNGLHIDDGTGSSRTIDVTPFKKWNGTTTITITANDGQAAGSASFTFIVNSVNEAPVANDDTLTAPEDALTFLDVLDNDTDGDLETNSDVEYIIVKTVIDEDPNATITKAADGSGVNIQPNADYNGPVTFTYVAADAAGAESNTATVTVMVTQVNDAPEADDEPDVTTTEDTPVTIDVLDGDTDIDQDTSINKDPDAGTQTLSISLTGATGPSHGSVEVVDGKIAYTPAANYNGTDTFEYFVTDGEAQGKGVVTVTITQVNDAPEAGADAITTPEDTAVTIDVMANDTDVDTGSTLNQGTLHSRDDFSISLEGVTTAPSHGDIEIVDGKIVYTPDENWYGTDTFTYFILDGHSGSDEGTVTVTVNSVNDLPEFVTTPANMELTEDLADGSSSFSVSDVETAAADLNVTVEASSNPTLVSITDVTITKGTDGARTVTVNPRDNQNGTANIKLRVTDGNGGYREYTFTVTVAAVNDAPSAANATPTINEDTSYTVAWNTLTSDVDIATNADSIGVTITTQALHGTAVVSGGNIVYTPNADWNGVDSFVYTVTDSAGATDTGTITVTVNQVNDAPEADDEPDVTTNEDTAVTIDVLDGDTDTDQTVGLNAHPEAEVLSISLTGATGPSHGSVEVVDGKIVYTPATDYNGTDTFEYYVTDGEAQDKGVVTVTIGQVNDDPVAVADSATTDEDTAVTIDVLANDTDVDTGTGNDGMLHSRDDFSISLEGVTTAPSHGDIEIVDGKIVYTPDTNWYGTDTFTYFILDGHGGSDEGTVTVTVGGENDAPVAVNDSASADEDNTASVNVLANDTDTDSGDTLTFVGFIGDISGLHGTLEGTAAGLVTFVPDANWNGSFTVTYQMRDADGLTDEATITITINAVNDDPAAESFSASTSEDTAKGIDVSEHISDVDVATNADSLTVTVEAGDGPAHGSVSVSGAVITYTPAANWNGEDHFTYTVTDSHGASDTAVITVTVTAVNDAPVADNETAETDEDTAVTIDVLDGDTDVDTDGALNVTPQAAVTIGSVGTPLHGTTEIVEGKIVYTPAENYNGSDSFTYVVTDGELTATATVTITVRPVNDGPVAVDDTANTTDGDLVTIDALANDTDVDTQDALNATPDSTDDFSITAVGTPEHGTAVIRDNKIDYTPGDTFSGEDSFTYTMSDGHGGSATATVTVTVASTNDPPATPVVHTPVDGERYGGESTILVTWSGFDIDGDVLGYTLEYYDGTEWHVVQAGLTETEYEFEIPETLTSITDLQFRVNASDAEFTSDYGYSGKVEVDKDIPANIVVTMTTADGRAYVAGTWTNQTVTVKAVSVTDASEVVFSYSIEDKVFGEADSQVVTSGVHTVYIRATDEFGNTSEFGGYLVRIDKLAPAEPQVSTAIEGADAVLSFMLGRDPGGSGNSYLVMPDGSRVVAGTGITWTTSKNGTFTFKIYDVAGNVTTFTVVVNQIDESAPVITCDSGNYAVGSTTEEAITATLSFTDSESIITARGYAVSDSTTYSGAYKSYTGAITFTQPGTYYIHAYARNAFGLTTYKTFGPFVVTAVENPETGVTPSPEEVPPQGDVTVDLGDVVEVAEGTVQMRMPGGEWTEQLTLEGIEPGTYIIEVMDENGNITTMEITITDEQIAKGQWKPVEAHSIDWYVWAIVAFALLLLLLLLFWRNVKVTMYPEDGGRPLRSIRRLRHRRDKVIVTVAESAVRGSAYGRVTLNKTFTRHMRGRMLIVMQDHTPVLSVQVPQDAEGRFEAVINRWISG